MKPLPKAVRGALQRLLDTVALAQWERLPGRFDDVNAAIADAIEAEREELAEARALLVDMMCSDKTDFDLGLGGRVHEFLSRTSHAPIPQAPWRKFRIGGA